VTGAAAVVVNYGSTALLAENLAPAALTDAGFRVVVVDNFTTPGEVDRLRELASRHAWELVALPENAGFGAGCNAGVAHARGLGCDAFVLVNPDVVVDAEILRALVAHVRREPAALVSPTIRRPDGRLWFAGADLLLEHGTTRMLPRGGVAAGEPWVPGTCLAVHEQLWERLGGFDDAYFLYWEDVDLSHRCLVAGGSVVTRADLEIVHTVGGTQGGGKSAVYYRYNCRNRLLFAARHLPSPLVLRWLARTPGYTRHVLLRGGRRQFVQQPSIVLGAVHGTAAGIALAVRELLTRSVVGRRAAARRDASSQP
jgi:N-acetylglucosaminyl-diphospho-decaprenol L-rhamnosyltransferase